MSILSEKRSDGQDNALARAVEFLRTSEASSSTLGLAEREALETIYRVCMPLVWDVVYPLLASAADADDVTQTVFLGLPRALRRYQHGNFEGWLRRVAARTALMRLREDRRNRARLFEAAATLPTEDPGWHAALMGSDDGGFDERFAPVRGAFYALPESLREVVFLRAIVGLAHYEIAEWLGISVSASYTRYCRGLQQVRNTVEGSL